MSRVLAAPSSTAARHRRATPHRVEGALSSARCFLLLFALPILPAPLAIPDFRLSLLGRFLCYAIVALGLDLIWGYTGILSLGHGVYFGLGAYCTAMYLKLEASGGKMPDFMAWSGLDALPWWWKPFASPLFRILPPRLLVPTLVAALLGFSIISLARHRRILSRFCRRLWRWSW